MSLVRECCLIFVILLVYITANTEAACCPRGRTCGGWRWGNKCNDGACVGTFECCGRGRCNFMCCNCHRGCRGGRGKRELDAGTSALEVFNDLDLNEDGKISLDEANEHLRFKERPLSKRGISKDNSFFAKMDINNNGFIDPEEFDEDLRQFKK